MPSECTQNDIERVIRSFLSRESLVDRVSAIDDLFHLLEPCSECSGDVASMLLEVEDWLWSLPREARAATNRLVLVLICSLMSRCREVRLAAIGSLGAIGLRHDIVVPRLIGAALRDRSENVRETAVYAIGTFGRAALPALKRLLKEGTVGVRSRAAHALGFAEDICPADAISHLIEALCDPEPRVVLTAAAGLARIGPCATAAAPALVQLLEVDELQQTAREAVLSIGPTASPALHDALKHSAPKTRARAAAVLAELEPRTESTKRMLFSLLWDESAEVANSALLALRKIALPLL